MSEEGRDLERQGQPSFRESAETLLEEIVDSPTLQSLLQVIGLVVPYSIGSVLVGWATASLAQREKERLIEFVELLAGRLETLEGQAVSKEFFATKLGHDMLLKALDESRRTRSRLKKELFARILRGAVLDDKE